MRNGRCENSLCARGHRARHGRLSYFKGMHSSWIAFYEKQLIWREWALQNAPKPSELFPPAPPADKYVSRRYKSCDIFCFLLLREIYWHTHVFFNQSKWIWSFFNVDRLVNRRHFTIETFGEKFVQTGSVADLRRRPNLQQYRHRYTISI